MTVTLPNCPTCGGREYVTITALPGFSTPINAPAPCPAGCVDGKVTVARLVALWEAVHEGPTFQYVGLADIPTVMEYLRWVGR